MINMKHKYVIGVDFGTDSVRALLADAMDGKEMDSKVSLYNRWNKGYYCDVRHSQFRHHPKDYLESLQEAISKLTFKHKELVPDIVALSLDTTASTPCLIDEKGSPLSLQDKYADNPDAMFVLWKDHTGQAEADEINKLLQKCKINYALHSGNYYSSECFWSKVLHLIRTNKDVRKDAWSVIELCDYIPAVLTGCKNALSYKMGHCVAGSKLMWAEEWGGYPPDDFFEALDPALVSIKNHLPKDNYGCDKEVGKLSPEWANKLGLNSGVSIGAGNIDSHSGAVGGGVCDGTVVMNLGTSACYMAVMPKKVFGDKIVDGIFGQVDDSILPGMVGFEAGLSALGDVYAWYKRLLSWPLTNIIAKSSLLDKDLRQRLVKDAEENILEELTSEVKNLKISEDSPLATDWFNGRRSPFPNNSITASISALRLSTSAPEIYYALAEATAFATKCVIEHLVNYGVHIDRLIGIGGISQKSPFIMQLIADAVGMRIDVSDSKQGGAMGSVIHAATVAGLYSSVMKAQKALCAQASCSYYPNIAHGKFLAKRYKRYQEIGRFTEQQQMIETL